MPRSSVAFSALLFATSLTAQFSANFENLTASAAGTPMSGQDSWFIPGVASTIDSNCFTYAGNTLGVPVNPNGGNNFFAGQSTGTFFARSQRTIPIPTNCRIYIQFDVCVVYLGGAVTPTNNIGSISFQPSPSSVFPNLLARWPAGVTVPPTTWNADIVVGPTAAGVQTSVGDPNFLNLPVGVWCSWGCTIDLVTLEYTELRISSP